MQYIVDYVTYAPSRVSRRYVEASSPELARLKVIREESRDGERAEVSSLRPAIRECAAGVPAYDAGLGRSVCLRCGGEPFHTEPLAYIPDPIRELRAEHDEDCIELCGDIDCDRLHSCSRHGEPESWD